MASPSPPSELEQNFYYYGLPSRPKLIARSSTHIWEHPCPFGRTTYSALDPSPYKSLRPAEGDPLLHGLWNDAASSLRIQILEAVGAASDWTAIDILRLGWNTEFHTTLLVSVKPESLSWSEAHPLTLRCKEILEDHGISNVHCEIRESTVTSCGNAVSTPTSAPAADIPSHFQLSSAQIEGSAKPLCSDRADLSDCLGTKISMRDDDTGTGTKGIYLALKSSTTQDEPKIVALTCRHVLINPEIEHQESQTSREVIQIDQPTYNDRLKDHEADAKEFRNHARKLRECYETEARPNMIKWQTTKRTWLE